VELINEMLKTSLDQRGSRHSGDKTELPSTDKKGDGMSFQRLTMTWSIEPLNACKLAELKDVALSHLSCF
jgi:hypothetical protein